MDPIDALDRARRRMLTAVVLTSLLWLLPQVALTARSGGLASPWGQVLAGLAALGALAWMFYMWRYNRFRRRIERDEELRRRLDDERVREVRRDSIYRSWWVLVVVIGVGVAATALTDLPAQPVLLALLLVAVDAPLLFFLAMDRG